MPTLGAQSRRARTGLRGTDQVGVRLYNERLVLSLVRRHDSLAKADIARMTGLSLQTISIITNQLSAEGLLQPGDARRGRVGQPSVPYSLNPDGAYAFGLRIGRRSADLCLIDFLGRVLWLEQQAYSHPTAQLAQDFALSGMARITARFPPDVTGRIRGLGIAAPPDIRNVPEAGGTDLAELWDHDALRIALADQLAWPVYVSTDIAAACAAELIFGKGADHADYLYVFIGSLIGGGLVLGGRLFHGRTDNAAALGALPAHDLPGRQLAEVASIHALEQKLLAQGRSADFLWQSPDDWGADLGSALDEWIAEIARNLSRAILAAVAIIDLEAVVIDGAFPSDIRRRVIEATRTAISSLNQQWLSSFLLVEGTLGNGARARGGAAIPLLANFTQDHDVLFKQPN